MKQFETLAEQRKLFSGDNFYVRQSDLYIFIIILNYYFDLRKVFI